MFLFSFELIDACAEKGGGSHAITLIGSLARLYEPDVKIQRYHALDSLIDLLKTL